MKKTTHLLVALAMILAPAVLSAEGQPLPLAEEGSPEAKALEEAHQSDLEGAMESPEEAASHQKALEREKAREGSGSSKQAPAAETDTKTDTETTPPPQDPPPRWGGAGVRRARPLYAQNFQSSGQEILLAQAPAGDDDADLAVESEPEWLKQGGDPERPPAKGAATEVSKPAEIAPAAQAAPASPTFTGEDADLDIESEPTWLKKGGDPENPPEHRLRRVATVPTVKVKLAGLNIETPPFIFNPWSANLSNQDLRVLEQVAQLMKDQPNQVPRLRIEAYTDNSGDPAINEALTIARANVVKAYLILKGIGVHRLEAKGLGDVNPIASNETKSGRARNRRVEFKVIK